MDRLEIQIVSLPCPPIRSCRIGERTPSLDHEPGTSNALKNTAVRSEKSFDHDTGRPLVSFYSLIHGLICLLTVSFAITELITCNITSG